MGRICSIGLGIVLSTIGILFLAVCIISLCMSLLSGCTPQVTETAELDPISMVSPTTEATITPEPLPANTVADAILGRVKTLTITDDKIIIESKLGLATKVEVNKSVASISTEYFSPYYIFTLKDNTGIEETIRLTEEDYYKVADMFK